MTGDTKLKRRERAFVHAAATAAFLLMMITVILLSVRSDLASVRSRLSSAVEYAGSQWDTYSLTSTAAETRSLMRVIEEAKQAARDIQYLSGPADETLLHSLLLDHYLSGILLLDRTGNVTASCIDGEDVLPLLTSELTKEALLNTADFTRKIYCVRIHCPDGSYIDMAAFGRMDTAGTVAVYYETPLSYIKSYGLAFPDLRESYLLEQDSTVVVTDGTTVVTSNDESLIGQRVEELSLLREIDARGRSGEMIAVRSDDGNVLHRSFGMVERGRTYHVYAFLPVRAVFTTTTRNAVVAMTLYAVLLLLALLLQRRTAQSYQERQLRWEREYRAQLKEAARRAESANRAKTQFLQRMSHDIRTPINGIQGMVEIGEYYKDDPEKQSQCRQSIRESARLLLELVNEVLDMGKLESGEIVLEERPFDLIALLDSIGGLPEQSAAARGIRVDRKPWEVQHTALIGSPVYLKRLLMNIYSNAVKYNKDNGSITARCRELRTEGDTAWFEFICADTGIGMSEEFQKYLFEPFAQEHSTARSAYDGTGLGMAIAKALTEKMGGTITFTSREGEGTTFRITLPFRIDSAGRLPQQPAAEPEVSDVLRGMRILLAEDNELNMEIAEFMLQSAGAEVTEARDGREAVELFRASPPGHFDAVLMDVMMPVLDGYQATGIIRASDCPDAGVPIIAMTANAFVEDRQRAREAGMTEHLAKPLDRAVLVRTLQRWKKPDTPLF